MLGFSEISIKREEYFYGFISTCNKLIILENIVVLGFCSKSELYAFQFLFNFSLFNIENVSCSNLLSWITNIGL